MKEQNEFFTSEQVEEQIEQTSLTHDRQAAALITGLQHHVQREKEMDAITLDHAWGRIAEGVRHTPDYEGEKLKPGRPRRRPSRWFPVGIVAAMLLLIAAATEGVTVLVSPLGAHGVPTSLPVLQKTEQPPQSTRLAVPAIFTHAQLTWGINSLDWSPDGKRIVSANMALQAWDATTGKNSMTFTHAGGGGYPFLVARWSPDGTRIATASDKVELWNAATGQFLLTLLPSPATASQTTPAQTTLAFSPGKTSPAAVAVATHTTKQLLSSSLQENTMIPQSGGNNSIFALAWSPDSKYIAVTQALWRGGATAVMVLDATTGYLVTTFAGSPTRAITWSPNGKYLAFVNGPDVVVGQPLTGQITYTYHAKVTNFVGLAWSPDSTRIAAYDSMGTTHVWRALTEQGQLILPGKGAGHAPPYASSPLAWSPDSKQIATVGDDVQLWNAVTGQPTVAYTTQTEGGCSGAFGSTDGNQYYPCVNTVAWSPDGKYIASGDGPGGGSQPSLVNVWKVG